MQVVVCGDSFNCDDTLYPGIHWTQQLTHLNPSIKITNLSVCGASNFLIHLQIDHAIKANPDFIIVHFTTSLRTHIKYKSNKSLNDLWQRFYKLNSPNTTDTDLISFPYSGIDIFTELNKSQQNLLKTYLLDFVDLDIARLENYYIINNGLNCLLDSEIKFMFSTGGFDHKAFLKSEEVPYQFPKFANFEVPVNLWDQWNASREIRPYFHILDKAVHYNLAKYYLEKLTQL